MEITFGGELLKVYTEHTYVQGVSIHYFNDPKFIDQLKKFEAKLTKAVGEFYHNHYAVEFKVSVLGTTICIGVNDGILNIGTKVSSHDDSKILEPGGYTRIHFHFKQ